MYPSYQKLIDELGKDYNTMNITLERIDNDKGYIRGNLIWTTQATQGKNKSTNVKVTLRHLQTNERVEFPTITEALEFVGKPRNTIKEGQILGDYVVESLEKKGKVDKGVNKEQAKGRKHPIIIPVTLEVIETGEVVTFEAVSYCCKHLGITSDKLHRLFRDDEPYKGCKILSINRNNTNKRNVKYKNQK